MPRGKQIDQETLQMTAELYAELGSQKALAAKLGISQSLVSNRLKAWRALRKAEGAAGQKKTSTPRTKPTPSRKQTRNNQSLKDGRLQEEQQWWEKFVAGGRQSQRHREWVIERHTKQLECLAWQVGQKYPANADFSTDDLMQVGAMTMLDLIDRFDPETGYQFWTFAIQRVRGAMIDHIRNVDQQARKTRRLRAIREATASRLASELGRQPTDEEVLEELDCTPQDWQRAISRDGVSLHKVQFVGDTRVQHLIDELPARRERDDLDDDSFREWIRGCTLEVQTLLYLYYCRQATMREIGKIMHLSESRVCQLHSMALDQLRKRHHDMTPKRAG